jgi:SAM-dependent methyltransferase
MPEKVATGPEKFSTRVFISWSGVRSKHVAESLKEWLEDFFRDCNTNIFFSKKDLHGGDDWYQIVRTELNSADAIVLCLTPENMYAPWINFECGAVDCLSKTVFPLLFDMERAELISPLKHITPQKVERQGVQDLVQTISGLLTPNQIGERFLESHFNQKWSDLETKLSEIPKRSSSMSTPLALELLRLQLADTIELFGKRASFSKNQYFAQITVDALNWVKTSLASGPDTEYLDLPVTLYPSHLVNLLKAKKPLVKAVAVVDDIEDFWPQPAGEEIRKNTEKESTRIFAFTNEASLRTHFKVLQDHAAKYNVYAVSLPKLAAENQRCAYDFSLIGSLDPLLAYYHTSGQFTKDILPIEVVRFSTHASEISHHLEAFAEIEKLAVKVDCNQEVEEIVRSVFHTGSRSYERKPVEMSAYIAINEYHTHEEQHAYFKEMMDRMIEIISSHLSETYGKENSRVLEFGAGTGLFTKRLLRLAKADVFAVEIDWACYHILEHTIGDHENVRLENRDSREYNPPGQFAAICTSFADHHIHPMDKGKYFSNVRQNLLDDAIFVVGDEFLVEHDANDESQRRTALELWHNHIIGIAEHKGQTALADLERDALKSGLEGKGDFKVSCSVYEAELDKAGLRVIDKELIGPKDRDDLGGIYVYTIGKKQSLLKG